MDVQAREVEWYRRYGKYVQRIRRCTAGREYVVGDWSWERNHPDKDEPIEWRMQLAGVYREPRPRRHSRGRGTGPSR